MLGQYNLLPLLKGWEYKSHYVARSNVIRGAPPINLAIAEKGWIMYAQVVSDDVYGTLNIGWQGADLQNLRVNFSAEQAVTVGALASDSAGYSQRYVRPNPYSTAGFFVTVLTEMGFYGSGWAYVPTVQLGVSLQPESTQATAYVASSVTTIAVTNSEAFIRSLRLVLDADPDMKISKELLELGPTPFEQKQSDDTKLLLTEIRDLLKKK